MRDAGQQQVVRAEDVAVMGITEILRHVPAIYRSYRRLVHSIRTARPDAAVLIDFPDVNFRLAKHLHRAGVPVVWFVSPQLWAWKRRRLRWVQQRVSRMLVIFPFEEPFYRARGVDARFVGHPLASLPEITSTREQFATRSLFVNAESATLSSHLTRTWVALLPGSRWKEVIANLPTMIEAAAALGPGYDFFVPVASTLNPDQISTYVFQSLLPRIAWQVGSSITLVDDAQAALRHSRAAVIASGTATVQAAVVGTPFVVVYRVSSLTYRLARRLIRYPPELAAEPDADGNLPVAMVNLIAGRRVVPELLNRQFTAERVVAELSPLLGDGAARDSQIAALAGVRQSLLPGDGGSSTASVVAEIVALLKDGVSANTRPFGLLPRLK